MKKCIAIFLLQLSFTVNAEWVKIICEDPKDTLKDGFSLTIEFDEKRQKVKVSGIEMNASINEDNISFMQKLGNESYFHKLNRQTGILAIQQTGTEISLIPHKCSKFDARKNKF